LKKVDFQENISKKGRILKNFRFSYNINIILIILFISSLLLRIYYTPFDLPLTQDALSYFWYANDISILGELPKEYNVGNNGWSIFLSILFGLSNSENFLEYMALQRSLSIFISCITVPIVFLICKQFFNNKLSIVGAAIFAFEPRVVQNSILGITDPIYVFFGSVSIFMILSRKKEFLYLSFLFAGLATIMRVEGFFILLTISAIFFIQNKKKRKIFLKYFVCIIFFILIVLPMSIIRTEIAGQDGLTSKVFSSQQEIERKSSSTGLLNWITEGFINLVKITGWAMIPIFILIVPTGFFLIWKNKEPSATIITILGIILIIPAFYAYTVKAFDTRYLLMLYPIFCILSLYSIYKIYSKINKNNLFLISLICLIFITSILFLENQNDDNQHNQEAYELSFIVSEKTKSINQYIPESGYLPIVGLIGVEDFPILRNEFNDDNRLEQCLEYNKCTVISTIGKLSLNQFLIEGKENGLTHLVVDSLEHSPYRSEILKDVFDNEQNYPYLIKIYDSMDYEYNYHVKIFEINYEKFDCIINEICS
jgi:hypothetical protein